MRPIARALRVFAHADNLPVIIHCIHGKDRTGLIVALLLLLLGVDEPTVVLDYAKSELELKARACLLCCNGHADVHQTVTHRPQAARHDLRSYTATLGTTSYELRYLNVLRFQASAPRLAYTHCLVDSHEDVFSKHCVPSCTMRTNRPKQATHPSALLASHLLQAHSQLGCSCREGGTTAW